MLDYNCQEAWTEQQRSRARGRIQICFYTRSVMTKQAAIFSSKQGKILFRSSSSMNSYIGNFSFQVHFQTQLITGPVSYVCKFFVLQPQFLSNSPLYILKHLTNSLEDLNKVSTQFIWSVRLRFPGLRYQMIFMNLFQPENLWYSVKSVDYGQALCPYNSIAKNLTELGNEALMLMKC